MQIYFKQKEIEAALKIYVAQQGINLVDKTVSVVFTAGRKDSGLSAELTIEDAVKDSTNTFAIPVAQTEAAVPVQETPPVTEEPMPKVTSLFA